MQRKTGFLPLSQFEIESLGLLSCEQARFLDGSSINPIEEASLILDESLEGLVSQKDLLSSARNDLKEYSIKCAKSNESCHDESSLFDDSSVFDSSWLSISSDDESTSDNIWDFRRFSYKFKENTEVKSTDSTSFCSLNEENSSYDHLLYGNMSGAVDFEDFDVDGPLFWPLERKFDWNSEEKWDLICISPSTNGGTIVTKYDGLFASKSVILSLNNNKKDGNENIFARKDSRLNISTNNCWNKDTSIGCTNSNSSLFDVSWDFDKMGFLESDLLDETISEATDFKEFDVNGPLFWPSERKFDWNPEEKWDFLCISPSKNGGKKIDAWILSSPVDDLKESSIMSTKSNSSVFFDRSSSIDSTSDHIFDNMGFPPSDLFDEIMLEAVKFVDIDVDEPLVWPSEGKFNWNPEEKWEFLCISPCKNGGKKIGTSILSSPPVNDLKEFNSSVLFDISSMSFRSYESTSDHISGFDSMGFLPSDLFDENMSEAIEFENVDVNGPLFWPSERKFDWNPEVKWDLMCISPSKNGGKKAGTESIKLKSLKRKNEDLKDECKRKKTRILGEFLEEVFVSNNHIPIGFDEFERNEGVSVEFNEDIDVDGPLFWPLDERKFDWNPKEKWDVICISPCKNEGKIGNESTELLDGFTAPNKLIKLNSLKRKKEDLNDGFKSKKNKSLEDLKDVFVSKDEIPIEKMVGLDEFDGHEGVSDEYDEENFSMDEMQYETSSEEVIHLSTTIVYSVFEF